MFDKSTVDYSLYLVTNNEMVPPGLTLYEQVEKAIQNGVTLVQLREKDLETSEFVQRARKLHQITQKYNIPLIINDRVDIALEIDAEGVHIGQEDMDPSMARKLLGNDKILGLSARTFQQLDQVFQSDANIDYVGMGPVYKTNTKNVKRDPLGLDGAKSLIKYINDNKPDLKNVLIGGFNADNIEPILSNSSSLGVNTNGVAVVSCIMAQRDAAHSTKKVRNAVDAGFKNALLKDSKL